MANALREVIALLEEKDILKRATRIRVEGVEVDLTPAPSVVTELEKLKAEEAAAKAQDAWERRIARGHVGGFEKRNPLAGGG